MTSKNSYLSFNEDVFFTFFTFTGLYFLSGNKYLNIWTFASILVAKHGAKILKEILMHNDEKLIPGGTTPWNPLKIPASNVTPAPKLPSGGTIPWNPLKIPASNLTPAPKLPSGGTTPWNPLKIPASNVTPAKHN